MMSFLATPTLWKNQLLWKMESLQPLAHNYVGFVCFYRTDARQRTSYEILECNFKTYVSKIMETFWMINKSFQPQRVQAAGLGGRRVLDGENVV